MAADWQEIEPARSNKRKKKKKKKRKKLVLVTAEQIKSSFVRQRTLRAPTSFSTSYGSRGDTGICRLAIDRLSRETIEISRGRRHAEDRPSLFLFFLPVELFHPAARKVLRRGWIDSRIVSIRDETSLAFVSCARNAQSVSRIPVSEILIDITHHVTAQ